MGDRSFAFLFGQKEVSAAWAHERKRVKDMMATLMAGIKPEGSQDTEDWLRIGRAIGGAIDAVLALLAAEGEAALTEDAAATAQAEVAQAEAEAADDVDRTGNDKGKGRL